MADYIVLNQPDGALVRQLVIAMSSALGEVNFYTSDTSSFGENVRLVRMPRHSVRGERLAKLIGWIKCLFIATWNILKEKGNPFLVIVTNPPTLPLVGLIALKLRGFKYSLIVYDVYPEAIIKYTGVSEKSLIVRLWRHINKLVIRNASQIVTISQQMAKQLLHGYSLHERGKIYKKVVIIPTWVDTDNIKPILKEQNAFARSHGQADKLTILYSGNIGVVHDLSILPAVADKLKEYKDIHFLVVGEGINKKAIYDDCVGRGLNNITFLPYQNEKKLPELLATADIGVVCLAEGCEGISMPSKTYYTMAAGSALLGISSATSDLSDLISKFQCGVNVGPKDSDGAVEAILRLRDNPELLQACKNNSRVAAEEHFATSVCVPRMVNVFREVSKGV